ncbi:chorion peroxidase isoform X2 [Daphnia magna]|uniref:chorion peroxidase isoform X2 n=1 Tax=Daphnia magna TaxID=35525 RepID=UPI001E1BA7A8|nr:chorion peroxidase isoform X2 [Daphnia magna]
MAFIVLVLLALVAGSVSTAEENAFNRQAPLPAAPAACDPTYPYRSFDGTCNNLNNPRYGQANTIFQRLMGPANYADGVSSIRLAQSGASLPSARLVSTTVLTNGTDTNNDAVLVTMQWGQFLDHDLTQGRTFTVAGGCCDGGRFGNVTANPNVECLHIPIPSNDPVYVNANCLNMVRNTFGLNLDGTTPSSRQQVNRLTHWIDGSQIYGNDDATAQSLRDPSSGKGQLAVSIQSGKVLLPVSPSTCSDCFIAGDSRVREQPLLTIMHTLWLREHNRVANALYDIFGSSKSDEFYYQEARRIVIAEFQHITYKEYLPVILGRQAKFSNSKSQSNPAIYNEFAAAAYRMGHSMLTSFLKLYEVDGSESPQSFFLANSFNTGTTRLLNPTFIDNALRGLLRNLVNAVDNCFPDDVTSQLFRASGSPIGGDLISVNMQRGRDHGLPTYVRARQIALGTNGPLPTTFDALKSTHSKEVIDSLKLVYQSVQDIDLFIGGVTEKHMPDAAVGPTFGYIIAEQFENLKRTDRFFYSDLTNSVSFTGRQLKEIRKVSLARIVCDNNDGTVTTIQPEAFRNPSSRNSPVACTSIRGIDFNKFYGNKPISVASEESISGEDTS